MIPSISMVAPGLGRMARCLLAIVSVSILAGCGPTVDTTRSQLVVDTPLPLESARQGSPAVSALTGHVWKLRGSGLAFWVAKEEAGYRFRLVDHNGSLDFASLLSSKDVSQLKADRRNERLSESDGARLWRHENVSKALDDSDLPMVAADVIAHGDNLILQSRYGRLIFVQYMEISPGGQRINFLPDASLSGWAKAAETATWWQAVKDRLGLGSFAAHMNLAAQHGLVRPGAPPRVSFSGGGGDLLTLIQKHGATLFSPPPLRSAHVLFEGKEPGMRPIVFEQTSLQVPRDASDRQRIGEIIRFLAGGKEASGTTGDARRDGQSATPPGFVPGDPSGYTFAAWLASFVGSGDGWGLRVADSRQFRCHAATTARIADDPSAKILAAVAKAQHIAVYVHGLDFFGDGGRPDLDSLERDWAEHINVLKKSTPSWGYCLVAWDTEKGISKEEGHLGNLFFGLLTLVNHSENYDPKRSITVVAHSAGGLYAKSAYNHMNATAADPRSFNPLKQENKTPFRIVTLGTPHQGAEFARSAQQLSDYFPTIIKMSNVRLTNDDTLVLQEHVRKKAGYLGVQQLRPIGVNPWLEQLNNEFAQQFRFGERFYSIYGDRDTIVKPEEAASAFGKTYRAQGYDHEQLLKQPREDLARFIGQIYGGS